VKIKTANLIGAQLDWAVAKCEGYVAHGEVRADKRRVLIPHPDGGGQPFRPSTDWAQGGPIIEREKIDLDFYKTDCEASMRGDAFFKSTGPTPLIAAMRCYVSSRLGYEVEVPDEL
jgi:hypothetical protein